MSYLQIEHNFVGLPPKFTWGKQWVAENMWKELLPNDKEVVYAFVRKVYDKDTIDVGELKEDELHIGREVEVLSKPEKDKDPDSPTYGKRIRPEIKYDEHQEWDPKKGEYVTKKIPRNVQKRFKHVCEASPEMLEQFKTLVGQTTPDRSTTFQFVYMSRPVSVDEKTFFTMTVKDFAAKELKKDSIFDTETQRREKGKI